MPTLTVNTTGSGSALADQSGVSDRCRTIRLTGIETEAVIGRQTSHILLLRCNWGSCSDKIDLNCPSICHIFGSIFHCLIATFCAITGLANMASRRIFMYNTYNTSVVNTFKTRLDKL